MNLDEFTDFVLEASRPVILLEGTRDLPAAACGIIYVNEANPLSGGTGHTIKICRQNRMPVMDQEMWRKWVHK